MSKADKAILERRLRPVYDAIDSDNPKKAIQEADKILKKHPTLICAKVLKAFALIRSERLSEGFAILDTYDVEGANHNETTLQAFVHCYKEAALPVRICRLYERAAAVNPTENTLTQLFMANVRIKNYKQQQQVAMRLFKDFNSGPYLCWAVMSVIMQSYTAEPCLGKKMYFPLAEKMITSFIEKNGYQACATLELHILILEGLEKHKEAEMLLRSEVGSKFSNSPANLTVVRRLRLLVADKNFLMVIERTVEALKENNDEWTLWTILFDAAFQVLGSDVAESKKKQALDDMVHAVISHCSLGSRNRGPYMARLELLSRLLNKEESLRLAISARLGEAYDLMLAYFRRFFSKPCCFSDLQIYLRILGKDKLVCFCDEIIEIVKQMDENTESALTAYLFTIKLQMKLGLVHAMTREDRRNLCQTVMLRVEGLASSQIAPELACTVADLAQLVGQILWSDWKIHNDWQAFYEMILFLEYIASRFSFDPYSKLILCRAYAHIGNLVRLVALTSALDIKSVQKDTLGHLIFPIYTLCGRFNHSVVHYTELTNMYTQAEREINECLIGAYKNGTFLQIRGLVELDERMKNSSLAFGGDITNRYISGLFVMSDLKEVVNALLGDDDPICWGSIRDNRDIDVVPTFDPEHCLSEINDHKMISHIEFVAHIKLRHLLCLSIGVLGSESLTSADIDKGSARFHEFLKDCKMRYPENKPVCRIFQSAAPVRLELWLYSPSFNLLVDVLEIGNDVVKAKCDGKDPMTALAITGEQLYERLIATLPPLNLPTGPFEFQENVYQLSLFVQVVAMMQIIITMFSRRDSSKNKVAFTQRCQDLLDTIVAFSKVLAARVCDFKKQLEILPDVFFPPIGDNWDPKVVNMLKAHEMMVRDRCMKSYEASLEDLRVFSLRMKDRSWT